MAPAFDVGADPADRAHHVLDDVGAGQRAAQLLGQAQTRDREDLVEPLHDTGRDAGRLVLQTPGEIEDQGLGLLGIVQLPGLAQHLAHRGVQGFGQALQDVAAFMDLAALDRRVTAEGRPDRRLLALSLNISPANYNMLITPEAKG